MNDTIQKLIAQLTNKANDSHTSVNELRAIATTSLSALADLNKDLQDGIDHTAEREDNVPSIFLESLMFQSAEDLLEVMQ